MKASKFPVTYNGEAFRVTVKAVERGYLGSAHNVKVYEKRNGGAFPFRKVSDSNWEVETSDPDDVIVSAKAAVIDYVTRRDKLRQERDSQATAWREFTEWDGEVTASADES